MLRRNEDPRDFPLGERSKVLRGINVTDTERITTEYRSHWNAQDAENRYAREAGSHPAR